MAYFRFDRPLKYGGNAFYGFDPVSAWVKLCVIFVGLTILAEFTKREFPGVYESLPDPTLTLLGNPPESNWERWMATGSIEPIASAPTAQPQQFEYFAPRPVVAAPPTQSTGGSGGNLTPKYSLSVPSYRRLLQRGGGFSSADDGCLNRPVPLRAAFPNAPDESTGDIPIQVGGIVKVFNFRAGFVTCIQ